MQTIRIVVKAVALIGGGLFVFIGGLLANGDSTLTLFGLGLALIAFALLIDALAGFKWRASVSVEAPKE